MTHGVALAASDVQLGAPPAQPVERAVAESSDDGGSSGITAEYTWVNADDYDG